MEQSELDLDVYELKMDEIVGRSNETLHERSKSIPSNTGIFRSNKTNSKKTTSKPVSTHSGKITVY
jgi:hypothetical protein